VIANDIIFAADSTWVRAFSAQTGSQLWSHQVNTLGVAPLAVANGILYVMSNDNHLYAFSVDGLPPGVNNPKAPELARLRKLPAQPRH
jgi:outer membrane protein assembly factor BamB